jgi:hypothetical protein
MRTRTPERKAIRFSISPRVGSSSGSASGLTYSPLLVAEGAGSLDAVVLGWGSELGWLLGAGAPPAVAVGAGAWDFGGVCAVPWPVGLPSLSYSQYSWLPSALVTFFP